MPPFLYAALYGRDSINTKLFLTINHWHHPLLDPLMEAFVTLGSSRMIYFYVAAAALLACFNRRVMSPTYVIVFIAATLLGVLLEGGLKTFLNIPRPAASLGLDQVRVLGELKLKYSLPSGHAVFAAVIASSLGWRRGLSWKVPLWLFVLFVCWSRIYVGAHYPLDVVAGTLVGAFSGFAIWTLYEQLFGGKGKKRR